MDRMKIIEDWWRLNSGTFQNLDEILPFIVLHKSPNATDLAPTPLLLGVQSLQAKVIGTHNPDAFREKLSRSWVGYSARVIDAHRRVTAAGAPEIADGLFPERLTGAGFAYRRGLFPVTTTTGQRMLMTYTTEITLH